VISSRRRMDAAFDAIRERLFSLPAARSEGGGPLVVALASRTPREGVTAAALGLAASISRTGTLKVLLIDYHPGARGVAARLGLAPSIAADTTTLAQKVRAVSGAGFDVLTLASSLPSGFEGDSIWASAFAELIQGYRLVLVDAGSMVQPLAARWSRLGGRLVLVVDTLRTTEEELARLRAELDAAGRSVDAVILSKRRYRVPAFLYRFVS